MRPKEAVLRDTAGVIWSDDIYARPRQCEAGPRHTVAMTINELLSALGNWLQVREDAPKPSSIPIEDQWLFESAFISLRLAEDDVARALDAYIEARVAAALEDQLRVSRSGQNKSSSNS